MLNSIEFKLKLEDQFKHGREKMASALANPKDDKREKAKLLADQQESNHKIKLLKQALKKYNNLLCDEDEQDEGQSIIPTQPGPRASERAEGRKRAPRRTTSA